MFSALVSQMPFPLFFRKNRLPGDPGASPAQGGGKYRNENESKDSGPNEKGENSSALELARTMGEWDDEMGSTSLFFAVKE